MASKKLPVLVTGGTGRLGRALVEALVKQGREVRVLLEKEEDIVKLVPGTVPYIGDITDEDAVMKACEGTEIVFHLAAVVSQYKMSSRETVRINTLGTRVVANSAKAAGAKRLFFASTLNVYGRVRKEKLTEESDLRPTDIYSQSKVLAEREIIESGVNYTIFRQATIYGPGFENFFFRLFKVIKEGKGFLIGEGKNHIPLVHISDAVNAFMLAMEKKASINKIYNISDGRNYTRSEILGYVAKLLGVPKPVRTVHPIFGRVVSKMYNLDSDQIGLITTDKIVDISKAKKELGFRPKNTLEGESGELLKELESYKKDDGPIEV